MNIIQSPAISEVEDNNVLSHTAKKLIAQMKLLKWEKTHNNVLNNLTIDLNEEATDVDLIATMLYGVNEITSLKIEKILFSMTLLVYINSYLKYALIVSTSQLWILKKLWLCSSTSKVSSWRPSKTFCI